MQMRRSTDHALGVRADARGGVADTCDVHAIASRETGDIGADRLDFTGAVLPRRVRERWLPRVRSGVHVGIDRVDASGSDAHQQLTGSWFRIRNLFHLQHRRTAELVYANRFHRSASLYTVRATSAQSGTCPARARHL